MIYRPCQALYQRLQCFTGAAFPLQFVPLTSATLKLRKGAALNYHIWGTHMNLKPGAAEPAELPKHPLQMEHCPRDTLPLVQTISHRKVLRG